MSPKYGILHDYDLRANHVDAAKGQTCVVCDANPMSFQWSDYSGEAMCTQCGTPYQIMWGSEKMVEEGAYPYLNLADEWVPIIREYFGETGRFTCLGKMMSRKPGWPEFVAWVKERHPEMMHEDDAA